MAEELKKEELNFQEIEEKILKFWQENQIFDKLREKNKNNKTFSFYDGPITANNPMGVHHAWGRTYKDLFQKYKAMKGYDGRFHNGFDSQGLWVEVEVEKELKLNSKKDIINYGLANFSEKCKERVYHFAKIQEEQSKKLGQWMDWPNSYFTMSDKNNEYNWYFLKKCHEKGWLYKGHRVMIWCSRCGTSLSQHEMADSYREITHKAIYVKYPILAKNDEFFLVWTTTPWTLLANTALAVNPQLIYVKIKQKEQFLYLAKGTLQNINPNYEVIEEIKGEELVGINYISPFEELPKHTGIKRRVIPWKEVAEVEGTGIVHIAPGCGEEDYELSKIHHLSIIEPVDENGNYYAGFGEFSNKNVKEVNLSVIEWLKNKEYLYKVEKYTHRYPVCWRCGEETIFRLTDEWFISCKEIREKLLQENRKIKWIPEYMSKRMEDWLLNMQDWCISRKRFWGLPLPFYPCDNCGKLTVVGSVKELSSLAVCGMEKLKELHRPWIDEVKIKCPSCNNIVSRILEVGDCWLDAGIMPFSTLKYLEDRAYWEKWFPADFICEMRAQIRGWFYALLFMSVTLEGKTPYKTVLVHEQVLDEKGREMHKSLGNAIWFDEAVEKVGADVLRWLYITQNISSPLKFGFNITKDIKRKIMFLWNIFKFFIIYYEIDKPIIKDDSFDLKDLSDIDKWIISKFQKLIGNVNNYLDAFNARQALCEIENFIIEDLSEWYIRRNRRRFWKSNIDKDKIAAYQTLYSILINLSKLLAPFIPFLSEEIYQLLKQKAQEKLPESVYLCDYPEKDQSLINDDIEEKVELVKKIINLGLSARNKANQRVRQPLKVALIKTKNVAEFEMLKTFMNDILEEINVKEVKYIDEEIDREGFSSAKEGDYLVMLDITLSKELIYEGLTRDLIRHIQNMRKKANFEVVDRIKIAYHTEAEDLANAINIFEKTIKNETLCESLKRVTEDSNFNFNFSSKIKIREYEITLWLSKV